jgi:uncharacterized LabA/DUF88 family protein
VDLCAVFVDVGYLSAASQVICLEVTRPSRKDLDLDVPGLVRLLRDRATEASGQRYLRTYWYDGAAKGIPNSDHQRIDLIDDVKVRLGRLNSRGQQKGVDALIYRDLMTLARERAISHAYLVAGDGDLIEGVRVAQDLGVHVTVVYVQAGDRGNSVSAELLREADRRVELTKSELVPFVSPARRPSLSEPGCAVSRGADSTLHPGAPDSHPEATDQQLVVEAGKRYARGWIERATDDDVAALAMAHPRIPQQLDVELLVEGEAAVGPLQGRQPLRHALRSAFWHELREVISPPPEAPAAIEEGGSELLG